MIIPDGEWFCPPCQHVRTGPSTKHTADQSKLIKSGSRFNDVMVVPSAEATLRKTGRAAAKPRRRFEEEGTSWEKVRRFVFYLFIETCWEELPSYFFQLTMPPVWVWVLQTPFLDPLFSSCCAELSKSVVIFKALSLLPFLNSSY